MDPTALRRLLARRRVPIVFGLVAVATVVVGLRVFRAEPVPPAPTPPPVLTVTNGDLLTVPKVSRDVRRAARDELSAALKDLYERAFLPPLPPPSPSPAPGTPVPPTPIPREPAADYFQAGARSALEASKGVFAPLAGTTVRRGALRYTGVGTLDGDAPNAFLLEVRFEARGERAPPYDRPTPAPSPTPTPEFRIVQEGLLYVVKTADGWRVAGFDLELREDIEVGRRPVSPEPTVRAARWMP